MPPLSVIIPARNEGAEIEATITSARLLQPVEIIVVDGDSTDATRDRAEAAGVVVLNSSPSRGLQQNAGASAAVGEVLMFLHADNRATAPMRQQLVIAFQNPSVHAVAFEHRIDATGLGYRLLERYDRRRVLRTGIAYGDQALTFRRDTFTALGGFPEVPLMEDLLLMRCFVETHGKPELLPGPLHISARRWQRHGVIGQSVRNFCLRTAHHYGVSPERLAKWYASHGTGHENDHRTGTPSTSDR